jgi:hypothetical protein
MRLFSRGDLDGRLANPRAGGSGPDLLFCFFAYEQEETMPVVIDHLVDSAYVRRDDFLMASCAPY